MFFTSQAEKKCWCGSGLPFTQCHGRSECLVHKGVVSPKRAVPREIMRPDYAASGTPKKRLPAVYIESPESIEKIREASRLARKVLLATCERVAPGVTTEALDAFAHHMIVEAGGYPSPLNYHHFPKSICTSVNEVVCHGIPDNRPLVDGDIINIDVTVFLNGVHGDCNATVPVGDVSDVKRDLMMRTWDAMMAGIGAVKNGVPLNAIGAAIEASLKPYSYGIVRAFCGHGVGSTFHTGLQVSHYYVPSERVMLRSGMVLTIEPMVNIGTYDVVIWKDEWTAVTRDLMPSAQYEHTLLVTDDGCEILTLLPGEKPVCPVQ